MALFFTVCLVILLANFLVAMVVVLRRGQPGGWLLVLLLSSTTGAAMAALSGVIFAGDTSRFSDVSLIFTGLAAVSALAALVVARRRRPAAVAPGERRSDVG